MQDRIQDHYATFRGILSLYLTNQCNLTCDHFGTGSGPKMKTALAQEETVPLAVNTNGYWALTVARGEAVLNALPGLSHIILSTDIYHARELPIERVADAAEAALLCGRRVDICTVTPFAREDEFTAKLDALLCARGLMHRVNRLMSMLDKADRPVPLDEALLAPWVTGPDPRPCMLVNRPTVLENRSVLACCNTTIASQVAQGPLILGHVDQTPLDQILSHDKIDPLIQALRVAGPAFLAGLLGQEGEHLLQAPYRQGDICGVCVAVMGDPERVKRVRAQLADHPHRRAIAMAFELTTGRPQLP